ncbi:MAG: copper homeostasis protein CutC [Eubacteriales bacterium]|nr:copper homeostasis protein CutC [Eubacteriales bacterium]
MTKITEPIVEICCGGYYDVMQAAEGGADRVELTAALAVGGLTPSPATVALAKEKADITVISMLRPRAGGFYYLDEDFQVMLADAKYLLDYGSDGLAFGCLLADGAMDMEKTKRLVEVIKRYDREAVVHRAFDCVPEVERTVEDLIAIGVDRILTSGQGATVMEGLDKLEALQGAYGDRIQLLAGCGVRASNVNEILTKTKVRQVHSSCKEWLTDPTNISGQISYAFAAAPHEREYDVVSAAEVRKLVQLVRQAD